jgi:hypothetical protein
MLVGVVGGEPVVIGQRIRGLWGRRVPYGDLESCSIDVRRPSALAQAFLGNGLDLQDGEARTNDLDAACVVGDAGTNCALKDT